MTPRTPEDLILVGDRWDHADAYATVLRIDTLLGVFDHRGIKVEPDGALPPRPLGDAVIEDGIRTIRHEGRTGGTALVTYEPAVIPSRSAVHVRIDRHPRIKDMILSIRYDRILVPEPDAATMVRSLAEAMRRYETDLDRLGRGCHRGASITLREVMDMLVQQCAVRWRKGGGVPMKILNLNCPTPWTDMTDSVDDPDGLRERRFLSEDARPVVERLLPTAMAVDWIDKQEKGTGRVSSRLTCTPLGTVGITSSQTKDDPMMHLRNLERLRLPEGGILDLP